MRKRKRNRNKGQVRLVLGVAFCLLCVMTVGYSAFSTNISLSAKGNIKEPSSKSAARLAKKHVTTTFVDTSDNIRYSGKDVNNYVCLDSTGVECAEEELYRIIGIFNDVKTSENETEGKTRIKLVKATSIDNDYFDTLESNNWTASSLKDALNCETFSLYNNSLIDNAVWYLGGNSDAEVTVLEAYEFENGLNHYGSNPTVWTGKVGLMYPSDYGYASSECRDSSTSLSGYNDSVCTDSNWLYLGMDEWLISAYSSLPNYAFSIASEGNVIGNTTNVSLGVRPVVYLKSSVSLKDDTTRDGSLEYPYLLESSE